MLVAGLIVGNYEIGNQVLNGNGILTLAPTATIAFLAWLFVDAYRRAVRPIPS
jgi:hypothetical protein